MQNKKSSKSAQRAAGAVKDAAKAAGKFASGNYAGAVKDTVSFLSKPEAWAMLIAIVMIPIMMVYAIGYAVSEVWEYMFDPDAAVTSALDDYIVKQNEIESRAFSKAYAYAANSAAEKIAQAAKACSLNMGDGIYETRKNDAIFKNAATVKEYFGKGYVQLTQYNLGGAYSLYKDAADGRSDVIVVSEDTSSGFSIDYSFNDDNTIKNWTKTVAILDLGNKAENKDPAGREVVLYRLRYQNSKFISGGVNINTLEYLYDQVYDARNIQAAQKFEEETIKPFLVVDNGYADICKYLKQRKEKVKLPDGTLVPAPIDDAYREQISQIYQRYYLLFQERVINQYNTVDGGIYRYYSDSDLFTRMNQYIDTLNECRAALLEDKVALMDNFKELSSLDASDKQAKSILENREKSFIEWLASEACVQKLLTVDVSAELSSVRKYTMPVQGMTKTFFRIRQAMDININVSFCDAHTLGVLLGIYNEDGSLDQELANFLIADPLEYLTKEEKEQFQETGTSPVEENVLLERGAEKFLKSSEDAAGVANSVLTESGFAQSDNYWQYRIKVAANLFNTGSTDSSSMQWFFDENYLVKDENGLYKIEGPYSYNGRNYYMVFCQPKTVVYLPFSCIRPQGSWIDQLFGDTSYSEKERDNLKNDKAIGELRDMSNNVEVVKRNELHASNKVGRRNFEWQDVNYTYVIGDIQTAELDINKDTYRLTSADLKNGTYLTTDTFQNAKTYYGYFNEKLNNGDNTLKDVTTPIALGTVMNTDYMTNYYTQRYTFDGNDLNTYPYFLLSVESSAESVLRIDTGVDLKKLFNLHESSNLRFNSNNGYCWPVVGSYDNKTLLYTTRSINVLSIGDSYIVYQDGSVQYRLSNVLPETQCGSVSANGILGTAMGNNAILESGNWDGSRFTVKSVVNDQTALKKVMRVDLRADAVSTEITEGIAGEVVAMAPGKVISKTDTSIVMYNEEDGLYFEYSNVIPRTQATVDAYYAAGQSIGYVLWQGEGTSFADISVYTSTAGNRTASSDEKGYVKSLVNGTVAAVGFDGTVTILNTNTNMYYEYSGLETVTVNQGDNVLGEIGVIGTSLPGTQHTVRVYSKNGGQCRYMYPVSYFNNLEDISAASMKIYLKRNGKTVTDIIVNKELEGVQPTTITATIMPTSLASSPLTWTITEGADLIEIEPNDKSCVIRGRKSGDAYIEVSSGNIKEKLHVYVPEYISMINIYDRTTDRSGYLIPSIVYDVSRTDGTMDLDAFTNEDATYQSIEWSIDDAHKAFATIDKDTGVVSFKKGMDKDDYMQITATATDGSGYSTTVKFRIVEPVKRITVTTKDVIPIKLTTSGYASVNLRDYLRFDPENATLTDLTFISQSPAIDIDNDGTVLVLDRSAVGRTIAVTVKLDDYAARFSPSCNQVVLMVQMQYDISSISLGGPYILFAPDGKNINTGNLSLQINPIVTPQFSEISRDVFSWKTSNASVISVDGYGGVEVIKDKVGKYKVSATLLRQTGSADVYVKAEPRVAVVSDFDALRKAFSKTKYLNSLSPIQDMAPATASFSGTDAGCVFCIQNPPDEISFSYDSRIGVITPMKVGNETVKGLYSFHFVPTSDQNYMDVTATYKYTVDGKTVTFTQEFYFEEH